MKQKLVAFLVVMAMISTPLLAQTTPAAGSVKIAWTSVEYLLGRLPDGKVVQNQLEVTKAQLDKALGESYKEYQEKVDAYQKNGPQMTEVIRADKEKELQNLQTRIQEMQTNAQQSLQTKQQQLMEPLLAKIQAAIQEVGKDNGFQYILNMDGGGAGSPTILYSSSDDNNASNLILRKLGVDPDKVETAPAAKAAPAGAAPKPAATTPAATPKKK